MNDLLSIVICTYNGEKNLKKVIKAIIQQEGFDKLVKEIVIVDNASTDSTASIIKKMQSYINNLRYIYEPIQGLSYARKHAAKLDTKWIVFLDDDNIVFDDWLKEMTDFIQKDSKLGVCNSACIAIPEIKFNKDEMDILYAVAPGLACTHIDLDSYYNKEKSMIATPFGAGMFIRTKELKDFLNKGWTKSIGRNKDNLSSGEDGEIANYVLNHGFKYGFNDNAAILHIIPHRRIELDYIEKLSSGLNQGYVQYLYQLRYSVIIIIAIFLKNCFMILIYPFKRILCKTNKEKLRLFYSHKSRIDINKIILIKGVHRK